MLIPMMSFLLVSAFQQNPFRLSGDECSAGSSRRRFVPRPLGRSFAILAPVVTGLSNPAVPPDRDKVGSR